MDLKACANTFEKCGVTDADVCNEKDNEDWELVTNKEEDNHMVPTGSVVYKSKAGGGAASKICFAKGTKDVSVVAPTILKREQCRGASSFAGGEICQWIQDKWFGGGAPAQCLSICLATVGECAAYVSTDQRHLVVEKSLETQFHDAVENLAHVFPCFAEACNSPAMADEVFAMLMENHPCFLARKKTEEKFKKAHGSNVTDRLPQECRIPLECKCGFDFVRKEEDKFFCGMESVSGPSGYTYVHVEPMGESDGFSTDKEAHKPTIHHQMASSIPSSVNINANTSSDMSVSSARAPSVRMHIKNNHNRNNSNRSSGNSVSSCHTSYSTASKASSKGKFTKCVPGLQRFQGLTTQALLEAMAPWRLTLLPKTLLNSPPRRLEKMPIGGRLWLKLKRRWLTTCRRPRSTSIPSSVPTMMGTRSQQPRRCPQLLLPTTAPLLVPSLINRRKPFHPR